VIVVSFSFLSFFHQFFGASGWVTGMAAACKNQLQPSSKFFSLATQHKRLKKG